MNREQLIDQLEYILRKPRVSKRELRSLLETIRRNPVDEPPRNAYGLTKANTLELIELMRGYPDLNPKELANSLYNEGLSFELHRALKQLNHEPERIYELCSRCRIFFEKRLTVCDRDLDSVGLLPVIE